MLGYAYARMARVWFLSISVLKRVGLQKLVLEWVGLFSLTNVYQKGYGFSKNSCQKWYFCKFPALRTDLSVMSNILDFRYCVNLH